MNCAVYGEFHSRRDRFGNCGCGSENREGVCAENKVKSVIQKIKCVVTPPPPVPELLRLSTLGAVFRVGLTE